MTDIRDEAADAAHEAGLTYVTDEDPGITRRRCGRGFSYRDPSGETIRDEEERARIESLAIPPGWDEVWISPREDGHIRATGRDDEGRKQYIYHPRWHAVRQRLKYRRIEVLGSRLPELRQRVGRNLSSPDLDRTRVVAGAIRLLDKAAIRVGYAAYAEENGSFGATTLCRRHLVLDGDRVRIRFTGKSGKDQDVVVRDRALAELFRELGDVPGDEIFCFRNGGHGVRTVGPEDVNEYLRSATTDEVSAKDFRTWAGSMGALRFLLDTLGRRKDDGPMSERERAGAAVEAVDAAAELLGNTRATAREFYVHPGLLRAFESGALVELLEPARDRARRLRRPGFRRGEPLFLSLLPELEGHFDEA